MKFSYRWLKELTGLKESPKALAELLTLRSFEVEAAGKVGNDWALEAKIPTNRISDAASHWGLAKEIAAIRSVNLKIKAGARAPKAAASPAPASSASIKIASPNLCPRYTAQELELKAIGPSPRWMRERLTTCGFRPINIVVDVTNYVMLETGQPLHAFDLDAIRGSTLTIRESRQGETLVTLDDTKHTLPRGALVIEDRERLIDLAGIMGGKNSAVTRRSRRVLLQAAIFDPVRIYRTTRALNFSSAASKIYAAGIDANRTGAALERAVTLLGELAGAKRIGAPTDIYPRRITPRKILLRHEHANRVIGENLPASFYAKLWRRLGFRTTTGKDGWVVEVPTDRQDIQIEEDLIEEAARLFGYDRLRPQAPISPRHSAVVNEGHQWEEKVKDILAGAGYSEAYVYRFVGQRVLDDFGASTTDLLELENPTNPATQYLGAHPAQQYLEVVAANLRHYDTVSVFGIAKGFKRAAKPTPKKPAEERKYLVITKAAKDTKAEKGAHEAETFYEVKGTLDHLFASLGIADHWYDDALTKAERQKTKALHPYRTAKIMAGDNFLGVVAELHPAVQQRLKSKARLVFSQIDFEKLWKLARAEAEFKPIGKYPAVIRDIAVVVPENTKADDVEGVIQNAGGPLLADSDLFDYFQDEAMEERGEKSLAFHLIFQSPERTLTDEEVSRLYKKIVSALKSRDWEVRE